MSKLVKLNREYWPNGGYGHWCPGCGYGHEINVEPDRRGVKWLFDGNVSKPTFSPSINLKVNTPDMGKHYQSDYPSRVCHYFIRQGMIQFLGDCTHSLKGQTVELPDIPNGQYVTCERL